MRAVVQRVRRAKVVVGDEVVGEIGQGLMVLLGVADDDNDETCALLAKKVAELRIFPDDTGRMNRSVEEAGGDMLVVSQFTLYGDCRKGRRPSFIRAAKAEPAQRLYQSFVEHLKDRGLKVEEGRFGADMDVELVNQGPVTLILDTDTL